MTYERSWSDWWKEFLGCSPDGHWAVVKIVRERYIDEMRHVKRNVQHAESMRYPQFRERLLRIAAEEERHAEWLAAKLQLFVGSLPSVPDVPASGKNNWQSLLGDLHAEERCSSELIEEMQTVREELPNIARSWSAFTRTVRNTAPKSATC